MTQRIRTLFSRSFWADAGERALKSAAQAVLGVALVGDRVFDVLDAMSRCSSVPARLVPCCRC